MRKDESFYVTVAIILLIGYLGYSHIDFDEPKVPKPLPQKIANAQQEPEVIVHTIYPYWHRGRWVFDNDELNLSEEAFVAGSSEVLSKLLEKYKIENGRRYGFMLKFSDQPFDGYQVVAEWERAEDDGNWYKMELDGVVMRGWLCPVLTMYFDTAPSKLYIGVYDR